MLRRHFCTSVFEAIRSTARPLTKSSEALVDSCTAEGGLSNTIPTYESPEPLDLEVESLPPLNTQGFAKQSIYLTDDRATVRGAVAFVFVFSCVCVCLCVVFGFSWW